VEKLASTTEIKGRFRPFDTIEGRILIFGLILMLLYAIYLAAAYFISPNTFQVYVGMTATHILFGRAAGMSFGYSLDFGHLIVIPINLAIEIIMVMLIYPLFVLAWRNLLVFKALNNFMRQIEAAAEANEAKIKRYGIPGLLLFVCIPFWMTGPVVGSVIGFFLGLRPWVNMLVVLFGTTIASLGWAVFLKELHERVADFSPFAPMILVLIIITIVVAGYLLEMQKLRKNNHKNGNTNTEQEK
jgi:uncharacterized membrane protein